MHVTSRCQGLFPPHPWFKGKVLGTRLYTARPTDRPSAPQGNKFLISHFLASLESQVQPDISHPCCDQLTVAKTGYPLTSITWAYLGLSYRPIEVEHFLKLSADKLLVFKWSQAQVQFYKNIRNKLCLWAALLKFGFQTDFLRKNSAKWSKFDRWVHAENLCSIWKLVYW